MLCSSWLPEIENDQSSLLWVPKGWLDYQPLFGNMSPHSSPTLSLFREERRPDTKKRRKSNVYQGSLWFVIVFNAGLTFGDVQNRCNLLRFTGDQRQVLRKHKAQIRREGMYTLIFLRSSPHARDSHFALASRLPLFDWNTQKKWRLFCKLGLGSWTHICNTSHTVILSSNLFQSKLHVYASHHQID